MAQWRRFYRNLNLWGNRNKKTERPPRDRRSARLEALENRTLLAVNPVVIDLLVPYTAAAMQGAGGQVAITNKINRAVADLNQTLTNSEVNATVRLVGTMETTYTESATGPDADIGALPTIPDIAAMKTAVGADLVDLWVGPASNAQPPADGVEGIAGEPDSLTTAEPFQGYAVQWWGDSDANLTVHEIGHMLGGGHVQGQDPTPHTIPYAYDYIATVGAATYGTAIDDQGTTGGLIEYYSNPNVFFRGVPVGLPDNNPLAADNASVMNQIAPLIAGYSPTVVADTSPPIAGLDQVTNVTGQNSLTFDVTYYDNEGVDVTTLGNSNIQVTGPNGLNATATFTGINIDGTITPIGPMSVNASVVQAQYTINTPGAVGDPAAYNFAINANQVKDINGNFMPAGPLLIASGANPNLPNPQILPRYGGDSTGTAVEAGNLTGTTFKITDFTGPYYLKEGTNWPDYNLYHFNLSSDGTVTVNVTGPVTADIYQDANGDGVLDSTEQINPVTPGVFSLKAGTNYYLEISSPWSPAGFGAGGVFTVEVNATGPNQPNPLPAAISGFVYQDNNNNGTMDAGDTGIANVIVLLTGMDINGNTVAQTATTSPTGAYSFANVPPSNATGYTLTITQPGGYPIGTDNLGTGAGTVIGTNAGFSGITVAPGATISGYNFGELPIPATTSISGTVYNDLNSNGTLDAGEPGIAGVMVMLTGNNYLGQAVNLTATTAANGTYSFPNLLSDYINAPNGYNLHVVAPVGYNGGFPNVGTGATGTSGPGGATDVDDIVLIYLNPGDNAINYNFGRIAAPGNQTAPVAVPMAATTNENAPVTGNVLTNAVPGTTAAPAIITAAVLSPAANLQTVSLKPSIVTPSSEMYACLMDGPQHAMKFSLNADGTFNYTPMPDFYGTDTFTYQCVMTATDRCSNTTATVTITVKHVDQPPTEAGEIMPDLYGMQGDAITVDLRSFIEDPDSPMSAMKFTLANPSEGTLTLQSGGYMAVFTPKASFSGETTIKFKCSDGQKSSGWITLDVFVSPIYQKIVAEDDYASTDFGQPILIDVLSNDYDSVKGAKLKISIVTGPSHGKVKIIGNKVYYIPAFGKFSSDSLVYKVTDQFGNSATATVSIDIAARRDDHHRDDWDNRNSRGNCK